MSALFGRMSTDNGNIMNYSELLQQSHAQSLTRNMDATGQYYGHNVIPQILVVLLLIHTVLIELMIIWFKCRLELRPVHWWPQSFLFLLLFFQLPPKIPSRLSTKPWWLHQEGGLLVNCTIGAFLFFLANGYSVAKACSKWMATHSGHLWHQPFWQQIASRRMIWWNAIHKPLDWFHVLRKYYLNFILQIMPEIHV